MAKPKPNPFDGLLPPGYRAEPVTWQRGAYLIYDDQGRFHTQHIPDRNFPAFGTATAIWWDYLFPGAPPGVYMRFSSADCGWDWRPQCLRPAGVKSLDDIGDLGG